MITTVLGGLGSLTGSVLGTIIVQILPEIFRNLSEYRMLFYGIAVVLVILLRPNGLYGSPGVQPETCHWIHDQSGIKRKREAAENE